MTSDIQIFLTSTPYLWLTICVFCGLCFGSLSNALAWRWPKILERDWMEEVEGEFKHRGWDIPDQMKPLLNEERIGLSLPRSKCPGCNTPIPSYLNIPVLSWLLLRGKARCCSCPIPVSYLMAELGGGLVGIAFGLFMPAGISGLGMLFIALSVYCLAVVDAKSLYLPDSGTLFILWLALALQALGFIGGNLSMNILGAAAAYLLFRFIAFVGEAVLKKPALGGGDWKFIAALVAWLGPISIPFILATSSISALIYAIFQKLRGKDGAFPFGPFLAFGAITFIFLGHFYINWLLASAR